MVRLSRCYYIKVEQAAKTVCRNTFVVTAGVYDTNVAAIGRIAATPLKSAVAADQRVGSMPGASEEMEQAMDIENGTGTGAAGKTMCRKAACSRFVPKSWGFVWLTLAIPMVLCADAVGLRLNIRAGAHIDIVVTAGVYDTNVAAIGRIAATPLKSAVAA